MNKRNLVACCVAVLCLLGASEAQARFRATGTFTNAYWHQEAGDLLGMELRVVIVQGNMLQGTLQWFEGGPAELRLVNVIAHEDRIILEDREKPGEPIFEGTLGRDGIRGFFKGFD